MVCSFLTLNFSGYSEPRETPRETPKATPRVSRRTSEEDVARAAAAGASAALTLLLIPALKEVTIMSLCSILTVHRDANKVRYFLIRYLILSISLLSPSYSMLACNLKGQLY